MGREDCGGNIGVVHLLCSSREKAPAKELPSLNRHGRQLRLALDDISNSEDVRNTGLVVVVHIDLSTLRVIGEPSGLQVQLARTASPAHGHENSVEDSILSIFHKYFDFSICCLLKFGRHHLLRKVDPMSLHVAADHVGNVLIKASQEDGAHHDGHVKSQRCDEAGTLQSNVRSTNDQKNKVLPGAFFCQKISSELMQHSFTPG